MAGCFHERNHRMPCRPKRKADLILDRTRRSSSPLLDCDHGLLDGAGEVTSGPTDSALRGGYLGRGGIHDRPLERYPTDVDTRDPLSDEGADGWARDVRLDDDDGVASRLHKMSLRRRIYLFLAMLVVTDLIVLGAASAIATPFADEAADPVLLTILPALICVCSFGAFGLYRFEEAHGPEEMRRVLNATCFGVLLVAAVTWSQPSMGGIWLIVLFALVIAAAGVSRNLGKRLQGRLVRLGILVRRAAIVGTDEDSVYLAHRLRGEDSGYITVGHVALGSSLESDYRLHILGPIDHLIEVIDQAQVDCLFVGERLSTSQRAQVLRAARCTGSEVRLPTTLSVFGARLSLRPFGEDMSLALMPMRFTRMKAFLKRSMDVGGALLGLILAMPVLIGATVAIKLSSPGPVLFTQERVTKGGRQFKMLKFRTMFEDADRILAEHQIDHTAAFFKLDSDPRITKVGQFLRRLSLDELPQLWNVLSGDMSLVGPRPLPTEQVEANLDLLAPRQEVRAGLTGWWQINGRSDIDPLQAVALDIYYIENWSLSLDLYVLLRTTRVVLSQDGAR